MADTQRLSVRLDADELILLGLYRKLEPGKQRFVQAAAQAVVDEQRRLLEGLPLTPALKAKRDERFQTFLARVTG